MSRLGVGARFIDLAHSSVPEHFYNSGGGDELFTFRVLYRFQNEFGIVVDLRFRGIHLCDPFLDFGRSHNSSVKAGKTLVHAEYFAA